MASVLRAGQERTTRFDGTVADNELDLESGDGLAPLPLVPDQDVEIGEFQDDLSQHKVGALQQLLSAKGWAKDQQEKLRAGPGGVFRVGQAWDHADVVAFLPSQECEDEDNAGVEYKPKPYARPRNWRRLQERLLRDHWWEMKTNRKANSFDRQCNFVDFIQEARTNRLGSGGLPTQWLDADRRYLNVLPNLVRRDKWLRNPPKWGATTVEVDDWPGGLKRQRFRPAHGGRSVGQELLRLDVEVLGLTLRDHMHFTEEDRIARLLADLFKAHTLKMHENKVGQLKAKVAAIKDALSIQPDGDVAKNYRKQLRYTREQIDAEHAAQKIRETQMRELWNKIKFLRSQQGFNGAAIKMAWQKKHVDIGKEQEELKAEIAERVQEQRDELDAKIREYNARIEKLEALKGEKESKRTEALSKSDAASAARYASAIKKLDSRVNKLQRMVPSITGFNEEKQTSMMMQAYKNIRTYMPGEPYLVPVMLQDPIDDLKDCPAQEKSRRAMVKGVTYHVRVELDGQLIKNARSPHMPMPSSSESSIEFAHRFPIAVAVPPRSLYVHVVERSGLSKKLVGRVPIPVPGGAGLLPQRIASHYNVDFASGEQFTCTETHRDLEGNVVTSDGIRHAEGTLSVRVTWDTSSAAPVAARGANSTMAHADANESSTNIVASFPKSSMTGDPNNPSIITPKLVGDGATLPTVDEGQDSTHKPPYFRLDADDDDLHVFKTIPNDDLRRNQYLIMRETGRLDSTQSVAPLTGEGVTPAMLEGAGDDEDILAFRNAKKKKALTAGDRKLAELKKRAGAAIPSARTRELATVDVVKEEELPLFAISFDWLFKLLAPRNPLRPKLLSKRPQRGISECQIIVQVVSAFNVPVRYDTGRNDEDTVAGAVEADGIVAPFVEVQFGDHEKRTDTQQGSQPQWNRSITLPYSSTTGNLHEESRQLEFNMFDQVIVREEGSKNVISERHEKRWLASFTLPFQTLLQKSTINGTVPLDTPLMNLGYRPTDPAAPVSLGFYATLDPPILLPEQEDDQRATAEEDVLNVYQKKWISAVLSHPNSKGRNKIKVLVPDSKGETTFVTRYIYPQNPPPNCKTEQQVVRFVSLLPFEEDTNDDGDKVEIWFNSHEFLSTLKADWEEHAILLANYFLKLQPARRTFVALGTAMPDGHVAYVLTEDKEGEWTVWNPCSGKSFSQTSHVCPLKDVDMLFNQDNVWANLQRRGKDLSYLHFDLDNPTHWRPFFTKDFQRQLATCQRTEGGLDALQYYNPNMTTAWTDEPEAIAERKKFTQAAEKSVKGVLEPLFEQWREREGAAGTAWMRAGDVVRAMKDTLKNCEVEMRGELQVHSDGIHFVGPGGIKGESRLLHLEELQKSYSVNGFPINETVTGISSNGEVLLSGLDKLAAYLDGTDSHENQHEDVQFAMAVKVELYPNRVCSVWVLALALVKR